MSTYNCPSCDRKISLRVDMCPHCGESLESIKVDTNSAGENVKDYGMAILSFSIFALLGVAVTKSMVAVIAFFSIFLVGIVVFAIGRLMNMRV